jgi:uncharacterized protein (TIGR02118 family)
VTGTRDEVKVIAAVREDDPDLDALLATSASRIVVHRPHPDEPAEQPSKVKAVVAAWLDEEPDAATIAGWAPGGHVDAYLVDEHVQIDAGIDAADGESPPGLCRLVFVRRNPDLTHEEMAEHWTQRHTPLVHRHHPAFWHYVQNVVVRPLTPDAPEVDGVAEMRFRSTEEMRERFYDSDEGQRIIAEDVVRFLDRGAGWRILSRDEWIRA